MCRARSQRRNPRKSVPMLRARAVVGRSTRSLASESREGFGGLKNTGHPGLKTRRHCVSTIDHMRALRRTADTPQLSKSRRHLALEVYPSNSRVTLVLPKIDTTCGSKSCILGRRFDQRRIRSTFVWLIMNGSGSSRSCLLESGRR